MSNIAEGFERANLGEKKQHYNVARASAGEVRSLLYVLLDTQLVPETEFNKLRDSTIRAGKLVSDLLRSLESSKNDR